MEGGPDFPPWVYERGNGRDVLAAADLVLLTNQQSTQAPAREKEKKNHCE